MAKLGKYGHLHRQSLAESRPEELAKLTPAELEARCVQVNEDAESMEKVLLKQGLDAEQAREIVLSELVLVPSADDEKAMRDGYTD